MAGSRFIRARIKSVKNTRKITKAVELVAASKMRRAISAAQQSRAYARLADEMVRAVALRKGSGFHPYLREVDTTKPRLLLVIASDRGLAGSFNANVLKLAVTAIKKEKETDVVTVGKRADSVRKTTTRLVASFTGITDTPRLLEAKPLLEFVTKEFSEGKYGAVDLIYTEFKSALFQQATVTQLLPMGGAQGAQAVQGSQRGRMSPEEHKETLGEGDLVIEPSPRVVIDRLLPQVLQVHLYQALLESSASEHAARMMAMRSASDAAKDMIDDLTMSFNQMRQAGITREIAEISGGKAALEG
ncbi:ATP synthase F1 subunit gamma [Candidatus Uhrbacteria bacterium]|nr:ATP synthase F1 subunit gamma [Candidatus Uhrbacteria bacterium]